MGRFKPPPPPPITNLVGKEYKYTPDIIQNLNALLKFILQFTKRHQSYMLLSKHEITNQTDFTENFPSLLLTKRKFTDFSSRSVQKASRLNNAAWTAAYKYRFRLSQVTDFGRNSFCKMDISLVPFGQQRDLFLQKELKIHRKAQ